MDSGDTSGEKSGPHASPDPHRHQIDPGLLRSRSVSGPGCGVEVCTLDKAVSRPPDLVPVEARGPSIFTFLRDPFS